MTSPLLRWRERAARTARDNRAWWWSDVAVPWLVTRAMLVAVAGWVAPVIPRDPAYPIAAAVARGWQFSPIRYTVTVFPVFALLAALGRRYAALDRTLTFAFPALQALMMALWSQFYAID